MHKDPVVTVVGLGYVGLSLSLLIAQRHQVFGVDINAEKISAYNQHLFPRFVEDEKEKLLTKPLNFVATADFSLAYKNSDIIVIATPTDYDEKIASFDTATVEHVISDIRQCNPLALIVIKSTVPVGFTSQMIEKFATARIIFSPEFLREKHALADTFYPTRIIIGVDHHESIYAEVSTFIDILREATNEEVPLLITHAREAEAIKLFANTYLALRIAFFNELDTYAEKKNLDAKDIIRGVSLDPRIGDYYNNPSFGYGGYCLPKDTKQLLANYEGIPQNLVLATVKSNTTRKSFIGDQILQKLQLEYATYHGKTIGIYRLTMKNEADNFRSSPLIDIIEQLAKYDVHILIYEPLLTSADRDIQGELVDFSTLSTNSDIIIANRYHPELESVRDKVYTRDLFKRD